KVTEAVFGVIRRMTEKKAAKRYQDPSELLADLDAAILNSDIVADTILSDSTEETAEEEAPARARSGGYDDDGADESVPRTRRRGADDEVEAPAGTRRRGADDDVEAPARSKRREAADAPAFMPPPRRDKPKQDKAEKPKRSNVALFYAVLGLLALGLVVWIV